MDTGYINGHISWYIQIGTIENPYSLGFDILLPEFRSGGKLLFKRPRLSEESQTQSERESLSLSLSLSL